MPTVVGALIGLVVGSLLTHLLTSRRDTKSFMRQYAEKRIDATAELYVDAIFKLDLAIRQTIEGSEVDDDGLLHLVSRLALFSTSGIRQQCMKLAADMIRLAKEDPFPGHPVVTPAQEESREQFFLDHKLYSNVEAQQSKLYNMMMDHLAELESQMKKGRGWYGARRGPRDRSDGSRTE